MNFFQIYIGGQQDTSPSAENGFAVLPCSSRNPTLDAGLVFTLAAGGDCSKKNTEKKNVHIGLQMKSYAKNTWFHASDMVDIWKNLEESGRIWKNLEESGRRVGQEEE